VVEFDESGCTKLMDGEIDFDAVLDWSEEWLPGSDRVAVERFLITRQTATNSQAPWSLMVIGVVTAISIRLGLDAKLILQKPADAMSFVGNDMLRALGLWHRGGAGHANDALRHAVLCTVNQGWRHPDWMSESF
jgi:hypothetical protein